jgi:hypothetical protein
MWQESDAQVATVDPTNGTLSAQLGLLGQDVAVLKREYSSLHSGMATLGAKIDSDVSRLAQKIDTLAEAMASASKTNWPLLGAAATLLLAVVGGGWHMVNLSTALAVERALGPVIAQNSATMQDRADLHQSVSNNREMVAELSREVATLSASLTEKLTEIETQFTAQDTAHNLARVDELRFRALVWPRIHDGERYPELFYAPSIGRDVRNR